MRGDLSLSDTKSLLTSQSADHGLKAFVSTLIVSRDHGRETWAAKVGLGDLHRMIEVSFVV